MVFLWFSKSKRFIYAHYYKVTKLQKDLNMSGNRTFENMANYTLSQLAEDYVTARMEKNPHHPNTYNREARRIAHTRIGGRDLVEYYMCHGTLRHVSVPGLTPGIKSLIEVLLEKQLVTPDPPDISRVLEPELSSFKVMGDHVTV